MNSSQSKVLGHHPGLFILFFTEMWERFSYYGMRALLVLFMVSDVATGGWGWPREEALKLYALYTGLVYITPIFGGILADKVFGYRMAVIIGAFLMTLGHASMAFETEFFFYAGLGFLILGNGMFKPNISSIVGQLYKNDEDKKDAAYTIFYMGINAGAFLGILLCGYIGEKVGWSYGFGLAGVFMFLGMLQFWFAQGIFGKIGGSVKKSVELNKVIEELEEEKEDEQRLLGEFSESEVKAKIEKEVPDASSEQKEGLFKYFKMSYVSRIVNDRLFVISIFAFFTIFFWMAFEQAGGSMTIFAKDYTQRILSGGMATTFKWVNTILTIAPMAIVTWVLFLLFGKTFKKFSISNMFLGLSFVIIWAIAIWMLAKEFNTKTYEVQYTIVETKSINDTIKSGPMNRNMLAEYVTSTQHIGDDLIDLELFYSEKVGENRYAINGQYTYSETVINNLSIDKELAVNSDVNIAVSGGKLKYVMDEDINKYGTATRGTVVGQKTNETEVPASWFGILNSFFIIAFAPLFSKIWESKFNPSGSVKFAIGLILLGLGFAALAYGGLSIPQGASSASVSMWWLIIAYLLHTLGELCLSPVGLSYVSKLAPLKLVGLMFGVWFGATAIANYLAGWTGSLIDKITEMYSLSAFFMIYTALPIAAGIILILLSRFITKKMHGIK